MKKLFLCLMILGFSAGVFADVLLDGNRFYFSTKKNLIPATHTIAVVLNPVSLSVATSGQVLLLEGFNLTLSGKTTAETIIIIHGSVK